MMPNVPNVAGVPALSSYLEDTVSLLINDAVSLLIGPASSTYDIMLDGESVFNFNSMGSFAYKQSYSVSDYKVEPGSFVSYDKVQNPFDVRMRIVSEGTPEAMTELLQQILTAIDDVNLYDLVTPQQTYQNCNMVDFGYEQTAAAGVGMLVVDLMWKQIRQGDAAAFSNTQQPGSAGQTGTGNVQPQALGSPETNALANGEAVL